MLLICPRFDAANLDSSCEVPVSAIVPVRKTWHSYTEWMDLAKALTEIAAVPVKVGLVLADTGLGLAVDLTKATLGDEAVPAARDSLIRLLGLDETIDRANRLASLMDDDAPLGRALAPDGPVDRLMRPGGLIDRLTEPDGILDRLTAEGGGLERALAPGGLVEQLLAEDGLIERVLAEDGLADRLLAEGGLVEKLTARNGPLEQLADVADTLNRLAPGLEALAPTIETLREAVTMLVGVVNPLSDIAGRIPLPGRRLWPFNSERIVDEDD